MKLLWFMMLISVMSVAKTGMLVDDATPLQSYNHRMALKMQRETQMQRLVRITPATLQKSVEMLCKEKIVRKRLTHKGQLLFYRIYTDRCMVDINALDGTIIKKELTADE